MLKTMSGECIAIDKIKMINISILLNLKEPTISLVQVNNIKENDFEQL